MKEKLTYEELFERAKEGDISILSDPRVSTSYEYDKTALHYLAGRGKFEILEHPDVDKASQQYYKNTPLHILILCGGLWTNDILNKNILKILKHPSINKVKNYKNETPFDYLLKTIKYRHYSRNYLKYLLKLVQNKKINN